MDVGGVCEPVERENVVGFELGCGFDMVFVFGVD